MKMFVMTLQTQRHLWTLRIHPRMWGLKVVRVHQGISPEIKWPVSRHVTFGCVTLTTVYLVKQEVTR